MTKRLVSNFVRRIVPDQGLLGHRACAAVAVAASTLLLPAAGTVRIVQSQSPSVEAWKAESCSHLARQAVATGSDS